MTTVMPEGENLRKAVRFVSETLQYESGKTLRAVLEEACMKFNLSPREAAYLEGLHRNPAKPEARS